MFPLPATVSDCPSRLASIAAVDELLLMSVPPKPEREMVESSDWPFRSRVPLPSIWVSSASGDSSWHACPD
jgi:hypothetical protein